MRIHDGLARPLVFILSDSFLIRSTRSTSSGESWREKRRRILAHWICSKGLLRPRLRKLVLTLPPVALFETKWWFTPQESEILADIRIWLTSGTHRFQLSLSFDP